MLTFCKILLISYRTGTFPGEARRLRLRLQNQSGVSYSSPATLLVRSASSSLGALEVWRTTAPRWRGVFVFFSLFCSVLFEMVKRWLHPEVRIRFSSSYPRSGCASSAGGGRVESCVESSSGIRSVIVFDGVVTCQSLPIYVYHHQRGLLLWCAGPLGA
jgi:hypothetical protein